MKVVIPAAGLGTRMLPATKEQPKEMLPLFSKTYDDRLCLKPLLQLVFEQLYSFGIRKFCFIIGRGKRAIEDYFTPDLSNLNTLQNRGKKKAACDLKTFYEKIHSSQIVWINQPEPKGFGDAILQSECFINDETFLVHAGDTYIVSKGSHLERLFDAYKKYEADAAFAVRRVQDPRQFGVIQGDTLEKDIFSVIDAVEKPLVPRTNLAIMPIYLFRSSIFDYLRRITPDQSGEIQLTDGILGMIKGEQKVIAINLKEDELWLDIGTPNLYWEALKTSFNLNK